MKIFLLSILLSATFSTGATAAQTLKKRVGSYFEVYGFMRVEAENAAQRTIR